MISLIEKQYDSRRKLSLSSLENAPRNSIPCATRSTPQAMQLFYQERRQMLLVSCDFFATDPNADYSAR